MLTTVTALEKAVREMLSATSPRARLAIRFEVAPPGQAATIITPTARAGSSWKSDNSAKPTSGSSRIWLASPTRIARGATKTRLKSRKERPKPMPSMMTPRAIGSRTLVTNVPSIGASAVPPRPRS